MFNKVFRKSVKYSAYFIILLVLFVSCGEDNPSPSGSDFDRKGILTYTADSLIIPNYDKVLRKSEDFSSKVNSLADTITVNEIVELRESWKSANLAWKKAEVFNFGPIDNLALHTIIGTWPCNDFGLEKTIEDSELINDDLLISIPSNQKGFPAIEYMLFHDEVDVIVEEINSSTKRKLYMQSIANDLVENLSTIYNAWISESGDYRETFINNDGNDAGASLTFLSNNMIILLEIGKNFKVATPLGLRSGGIKDSELVESPYANISVEQIVQNMDIIEECFKGDENTGFDVYLDAVNARGDSDKLSTEINEQFIAIDNALSEIDNNLMDAIENDEQDVMNAFIEMQKLTTLLKTDMMSSLGLLVTFSDNDGD